MQNIGVIGPAVLEKSICYFLKHRFTPHVPRAHDGLPRRIASTHVRYKF